MRGAPRVQLPEEACTIQWTYRCVQDLQEEAEGNAAVTAESAHNKSIDCDLCGVICKNKAGLRRHRDSGPCRKNQHEKLHRIDVSSAEPSGKCVTGSDLNELTGTCREPMPQRVSPPAPKKTGAAPSSTLRSVPAPSSAASQLLIPSKPAVEATSLSNDEALKPAMAILSSFKKDKGKDKIIQVCVLCWAHSCMITCCNVVDTHVCCRSRHPNCCPVL